MLAIVDYGVGNLFSLKASLEAIGQAAEVTADPTRLAAAPRLILPGVGAFADAAEKLRGSGLAQVIIEQAQRGTPLLGICLGMQLLFDRSYEFGEYEGLGLIPGVVRPIAQRIPAGLKVPHIGWNALHCLPEDAPAHPLFRHVKEGDCVYFVHSYAATDCDEAVIATTDYGAPLTAAVARGNVLGCQFHPEKSGPVGLEILRAFCEGAFS